jgi:hypothetical protein
MYFEDLVDLLALEQGLLEAEQLEQLDDAFLEKELNKEREQFRQRSKKLMHPFISFKKQINHDQVGANTQSHMIYNGEPC